MMSLSKRMNPIFLLRLLALAATFCATVIMVTSRDSVIILGMRIDAKYSDSPTFKYFVLMNSIAAVYSFVLLFPLEMSCGHLILVLDLIMVLLLDSSISGCLAMAQVGKNGNIHAGWLPICDQVPKFCDHITGALIAGFVAAILYFLIFMYSLHKAINLFAHKN